MARPIEAEIRAKRKYARVEYDLWRRNVKLTDEGRERLDQVFEGYLRSLTERGLSKKRIRSLLGPTAGNFEVLKEDAEAIKAQIEEILNDARYTHPVEVSW